jgi:hypothetical protein
LINKVETSTQASPDRPAKTVIAPVAWDRFGTEIVSMMFNLVHFGSLTERLQPE